MFVIKRKGIFVTTLIVLHASLSLGAELLQRILEYGRVMPYEERERRIQQRIQYKQFLLLNIFKLPPSLLAPLFPPHGHIYEQKYNIQYTLCQTIQVMWCTVLEFQNNLCAYSDPVLVDCSKIPIYGD
jgi:hypothetical protein